MGKFKNLYLIFLLAVLFTPLLSCSVSASSSSNSSYIQKEPEKTIGIVSTVIDVMMPEYTDFEDFLIYNSDKRRFEANPECRNCTWWLDGEKIESSASFFVIADSISSDIKHDLMLTAECNGKVYSATVIIKVNK